MTFRIEYFFMLIWIFSIQITQAQTDSQCYFPKGEKIVGIEDFFLDIDPVIVQGQKLSAGYRLGIRAGYFLVNGWNVTAGISQSAIRPDPSLPPQLTRRWNILYLQTRYYLVQDQRWTPFAEAGLSIAGNDQRIPYFGPGAGLSTSAKIGLALRINQTWSADLAIAGVYPIGEATVEPYGRPPEQLIAWVPKWGLNIHW